MDTGHEPDLNYRKIHEGVTVVDMHCDVTIDIARRRQEGEKHVLERVFLPRWQQGGVKLAVVTIGGDSPSLCPLGTHRPLESALLMAESLISDIEESAGKIVVVRSKHDIDNALSIESFPVVLHLEGASPCAGDLSVLRLLYHLGLRSIGLTWNLRNAIADGLNERRTGGGLTNYGVRLLQEVRKLGMIVDLAHISETGFWQTLEVYDGPIVVSHANAAGLHFHERNLTDRQIEGIREKDGIIGVTFFPALVSAGRTTVKEVVNHIKYIRRILGIDHIAIGGDFIDYMTDIVIPNLRKQIVDYGENFQYPEGLEDTTKLPNLTKAMLEDGFTPEEVRKVLGDNFCKFFERATGGVHS